VGGHTYGVFTHDWRARSPAAWLAAMADREVTEELAAPLDAQNTAGEPTTVIPKQQQWRHNLASCAANYEFPPHSFTVISIE